MAACADKMSNVIRLQHAAKLITHQCCTCSQTVTPQEHIRLHCHPNLTGKRHTYIRQNLIESVSSLTHGLSSNSQCLPCRGSKASAAGRRQKAVAHRVGAVDHAAHGALHLLSPSGVQQQHPAGWAAADKLCHVAACTASAHVAQDSEGQVSTTQSRYQRGHACNTGSRAAARSWSAHRLLVAPM